MVRARKLRVLTLEPGERPHIAAASGLVRVREWLYVVADDENFLGVFPRKGSSPGRRVVFNPSPLPSDPKKRKEQKPDFEALAHLPSKTWPPHGALLALGSGSKPQRRSGLLVALQADGSAAEQRQLDLTPLYTALEEKDIPDLNIEGAAVSGDSLRLLQRGNGRAGVNAVIDLDLDYVCRSAAQSIALHADLLRDIRRYDLGAHGGVRVTFTDASPLPDGRLVFTAVAEDVQDTYQDGPVVAASIGIIDKLGRVAFMEPLEPLLKFEGIHATLEKGEVAALLVADADDESHPAPLLAARLRDPAR